MSEVSSSLSVLFLRMGTSNAAPPRGMEGNAGSLDVRKSAESRKTSDGVKLQPQMKASHKEKNIILNCFHNQFILISHSRTNRRQLRLQLCCEVIDITVFRQYHAWPMCNNIALSFITHISASAPSPHIANVVVFFQFSAIKPNSCLFAA